MTLTQDEIAIITSRFPFHDVEPGEERLQQVSAFMHDAERIYMLGAEAFFATITAYDDDGTEVTVQWEAGDDSVGIQSGWHIAGKVTP